MNILVTGCTGFLGKNFVKFAFDRELHKKLICIARRQPNFKYSHKLTYLQIPQLAYLSIEQYRKIIEKYQIEAIIHIAALAGERKGSWKDYLTINVNWSLKLAKAFIKANVNHSRFIYVSTVGVHGSVPRGLPVCEATCYAPDGYYHSSKALAELGLLKIAEEAMLPLVILRPTIMYGIYDQGFLWKMIKISRKYFMPLLYNPTIHLLDVGTMVQTIYKCLLMPFKQPDVFIVADKTPIKLRDLLYFMNKHIADMKLLNIPYGASQLTRYLLFPFKKFVKIDLLFKDWYYDTNKLRQKLGIKLHDTLEKIGNYIGWYKQAC